MGIHNLFGICLAVFSVSALAADPPVPRSNVSVTVNPTTGYYSSTNSTVRLPSGVSVSPSSSSVPVVSKYSGGLQQTIPTGITIDAIKKSAPLPAVVRSTTQSVKGAATRCLTSGRCNVALMLAGAGISKLLDDLDWVMGQGGKIQTKGEGPVSIDQSWTGLHWEDNGIKYSDPMSYCHGINTEPVDEYYLYGSFNSVQCLYKGSTYRLKGGGRQSGSGCPTGVYSESLSYCVADASSPVEPSYIAAGVDSSYVPEPSDWVALTPELNLDDVEITSAPTLSSNPKTTTIYDANGNPVEVQETNIWYDFDIRDNRSSSPALDLKTRQETKTYKDGALTGTTTTTDTDSAGPVAGGGGSNVEIDIPTDCDFMPTVCAFLDWFKNDDTPEDPDLSALIDNRDFTETYSITGGSKQCPADYEFTVDFIGRTYGLSFEPACDFASKMYYFVMAAAYIFCSLYNYRSF